jgi:hypothetical protein
LKSKTVGVAAQGIKAVEPQLQGIMSAGDAPEQLPHYFVPEFIPHMQDRHDEEVLDSRLCNLTT